jgi:hypothetical protein
MAYDHESSVDFQGNASGALDRAKDLLGAKGFKVLPSAGNQLWFTHPVVYMNAQRNPLSMVSKGCITATGSSLTLQAELGNLRALVKFLVLLLGVMALPEVAIVAVVAIMVAKQPVLLWLCPISVVPFPIILLAMPKIQGRITGRALDALLNDITAGDGGTAGSPVDMYGEVGGEKRYWFRAKRTGWGWDLPLTWEGWLVTVAIIAAAVGGEMALSHDPAGIDVLFMMVMVGVLVGVCLLKGEPLGRR